MTIEPRSGFPGREIASPGPLAAASLGRRSFLELFSVGTGLLLTGCGGGSGSSSIGGGTQTAASAATPVPVPVPVPVAAPVPPPVTTAVAAPVTSVVNTVVSRPLRTKPTLPSLNVITVDLDMFDPALPMPGWDGKQASQTTTAKFPIDRDLVVKGHRSRMWTGGGYIRGGRNVHWIGGTYLKGPWLRNFTGDACMEGILTRAFFSEKGAESGDSFAINPDSTTLAKSRVFVLNCRAENIDGFFDGNHGDCFQLSSHNDPPAGYSSCPQSVVIERFTGSTAYQGLFLPNQHFDAVTNGYTYSCKSLSLIDVNLKKTRANTMYSDGRVRGRIILLFMIGLGTQDRGDQPYPKIFRNVYVEPYGTEGVDGCICPAKVDNAISPYTKTKLLPIISADGKTASYPPEMRLDGVINAGPPPGGDFAAAADANGFGGLNRPGIGYVSPGYL